MNYFFLVFLLFLGLTANVPFCIAAKPPSIVISHNAIVGEFSCEPLKCYLRPKNQTNLLLYPFDGSDFVASLSAGESAKVIHYEVRSIPDNGKTLITAPLRSFKDVYFQQRDEGKPLPIPGEYIYILFYLGEGYYSAWYNDTIIIVPREGISGIPLNGTMGINSVWAEYKGVKNRGEEIWFCLRKSSGQEGWVKFNHRDDWYSKYKGWGIFIDKP